VNPEADEMKNLRLLFVFGVLFYVGSQAARLLSGNPPGDSAGGTPPVPTAATEAGDAVLADAFARRLSLQVEGRGTVARILADDNDGSRHQRLIVQVSADQTVLIAHNIDLAPRVVNVRVGDEIAFFGEYEWNREGGVIHWTHHDPAGQHVAGWLRHDGRVYQ
jgi:hypothetical protein